MSDAPPPGWGQPTGPPPGQGRPGYPQGPPGHAPQAPGPQGYGPQGYGPQGYGPYGQPPPRKRRTGLIVVVAVLALLAIGFGGAALVLLAVGDDDDPAEVVSEIATTLSEMASPGTVEATTPPTAQPFETPSEEAAPPPGDAVDQSVFELEVGTCFNDPETAEEIQSVNAVPCETAHDNEVFALIDHPAGSDDPYPGRESLTEFAEEECRGQVFTDYVGTEYQFSRFFVSQLTPTDGSWEQGDREIVCLLFDPAEETVGSVRGSGE